MVDQPSLFDPPPGPKARATDPETSHEAATVTPIHIKASHRKMVLEALERAGEEGLTDFDLERITGVQQTSIGVRRGELMKLGLVANRWLLNPALPEDPDKRWIKDKRPAPSGAKALVWVHVDFAIDPFGAAVVGKPA